jgi:hypothetical protein
MRPVWPDVPGIAVRRAVLLDIPQPERLQGTLQGTSVALNWADYDCSRPAHDCLPARVRPLALVTGEGLERLVLSGCWGTAGYPGCREALSARDAGGRSVALIALDGPLCQLRGSRAVAGQVHDFGEIEGGVTL